MAIMPSIFLLLEKTAPMLSISLMTDSELIFAIIKYDLFHIVILGNNALQDRHHILTTLMVRI